MVGSDLESSGVSSKKRRRKNRVWTGTTGRRYQRDPSDPPRSGGMAIIYRVTAEGPPRGTSKVAEGQPLALKLSTEDDLALETMAKEVKTFRALDEAMTHPPCPRLYDVVEKEGRPVGMVMEWCPTDMERWWDGILVLPDALEPLCRTLSDVCQRIGEYHAFFAKRGIRSVHADIKPRNVALADDGRWLIIDFGAAKSRPIEQEAWDATRLILGTENFIAPEMLFNARKRYPEAMDTWSVALTFFTMLQMRRYRLEGQELPPDGTHNILFRSHRMATVVDLRQRTPTAFADKDLDPTAFTSPDRLPDPDRRTISTALQGVFGEPDSEREAALETVILDLLDKALAIDPARRFTRAEDLAEAFDGVVRRYWELEGSLKTRDETTGPESAAVEPDTSGEPQPAPPPVEPPPSEPASAEVSGSGRHPSPGAGPSSSAGAAAMPPDSPPPGGRTAPAPPGEPEPPPVDEPTSPGGAAVASTARHFRPDNEAPSEPAEPSPAVSNAAPAPPDTHDVSLQELRQEIRALASAPRERSGAPFWLILAIGLLLICQTIQFGLLLTLLWRGMGSGLSQVEPTSPDAVHVSPADPGSADEPAAPVPTPEATADPAVEEPSASDTAGPPAEATDEPDPEGEASSADEPASESPVPQPSEAMVATVSPAPGISSGGSPGTASSRTSTAGGGRSSESGTRSTRNSRRPSPGTSPGSAAATSAEPASETVTAIRVEGANAWLEGPDGRCPPGEVTAGNYEVFAQPGSEGDYVSLGQVSVGEGQEVVFRCGFGSCRRMQ